MNSFATPQYNRETSTPLPFSRVHDKQPLAEDLYSRMFDAILDQRIAPASRFTEESLGQMFGASRSPVRQVLIRLSHEQVVVLRPNHRPQVAAPSFEHTRQILHARRLTETTLIELACQQNQPDALTVLRKRIEEHRQYLEAGQRGPAIRLSGEFHLQLAKMAGNAPLANFLGSLVPQSSLAIAQHAASAQIDCSWQRHAAIVDALECTDTRSAVHLMTQLLVELEQRLASAQQNAQASAVALANAMDNTSGNVLSTACNRA
jgi:DNA-binding GntR family transcriptional regulator